MDTDLSSAADSRRRPDMRTVVLALDLPREYVMEIRQAFPDLRIVVAPDHESRMRAAPEADVIFGGHFSRALAEAAQRVRWLHAMSAGVDQWLDALPPDRDVILTNSSGIHGAPISEVILGMALCFATGLHTLIAAQRSSDRGHLFGGASSSMAQPENVRDIVRRHKFDLEGQTMGIVGLGSIGEATARKASALGMRVVAQRRQSTQAPPFVDRLFEAGRNGLHQLLQESDHVALCLPLTPGTDRLIGEPELRAMKPTAYIYNIGRGATIDQPVLERALAEGWIAGAGLDVTMPEPPAADSALWDMPNVILSQHTSGYSPQGDRRLTDLFMENLRRFLSGEPLLNQVDRVQRY